MPDDPALSAVLARRLRPVLLPAAILAAVLACVGLLPGERVYDDANGCFGRALAAFATTEHAHATCEPSYTELRRTYPAGGLPMVLYAVLLIAPAPLVLRKLTRARVWAYLACTIGAAIAAITAFMAFDFHLDLFSHTEVLWPSRVVHAGVLAIQGLLLIGVPIAVLGARPPGPLARVHRGG